MRWFKVKLRLAFNEQVTFAASAFKPIRTSSRKHFITPQSSSLVKSFSDILPQSFPLTHRKFKVLCHKILFANIIITRVIKLEHMSWIMHCKIKLETKRKIVFHSAKWTELFKRQLGRKKPNVVWDKNQTFVLILIDLTPWGRQTRFSR